MGEVITYAIGDIHGCHDLLVWLLWKIRHHTAGRPYRLVFLGDYIDRGPDSASVVQTVRRLQDSDPAAVICLRGNHEDMLLQCLSDPNNTSWWLENGGSATLASFGVSEPRDLPDDVAQWMADLPTSFEDEHRLYVHAGLAPGQPISRQTDYDKLWIREPFLTSRFNFGKHVVHGHTPVFGGDPDVQRNRTNLDTGAVFGGGLSAGVFTGAQRTATEFLQAFW